MTINITIEGGACKRLLTAGKYCDKDIVIKAEGGAEVNLQSKTATPNKSVQEIMADEGYNGLEKVTVEPIPDEYIIPNGTLDVAENGTHDVKNYESVAVNVPIPEGYIQPSGTLDVTENGTHDVTNYAAVAVNVPTGGGGTEQFDALIDGSITEITSAVTKVRNTAFQNIDTLIKVNLPNATTIGVDAFNHCGKLEEINVPNVDTILTAAFERCTALKEISLPKLKTIPTDAFLYCTALKKVDIFAVTNTGADSFSNCTALEAFIIRGTSGVCPLNSSSFKSSGIAKGTGFIYVPSALVASYQSATRWSDYASQIRALEDYTVDGTITGELDESKI